MNTTTTAPAEPPVGTLVRDRHGAIHRRYADGWGEEFDYTYHLGVWAAIWEARGPLVEVTKAQLSHVLRHVHGELPTPTRESTETTCPTCPTPPHGFTGRMHEMDARVGGRYRMSFTHLGNGQTHSFGGTFLELQPNERIRHNDRFDDPQLPGEMVTQITFKTVLVGTEVHIEQTGIPDAIPAEACCLGWQESLQLLALLVEAEIPT